MRIAHTSDVSRVAIKQYNMTITIIVIKIFLLIKKV